MNRGLKLRPPIHPTSLNSVAGVSPMNRGLKPRVTAEKMKLVKQSCRSFPDE